MAAPPAEQTNTDHAIEDDHHRGKDRIAGQPTCRLAPRDHERHNERNLDGRDSQCKHQCAERFTNSMSYHLCVKDGRENTCNQARDK